MMTVVTIVLLVSIMGTLTAAWIAYSDFDRKNELTRRVDALLHGPARAPATGKLRRSRLRLASWLRRGFTVGFSRVWGMSASLGYLTALGLVSAIVTGALAHLVLRFPGYVTALVMLGAFSTAPRLLLGREQRQADAKFSELLPDAIDMVVRMVRAGLPVSAAIRAVGTEADWPVSRIFSSAADLAEIGMPLSQALAKIGNTAGNPDFRFFTVTVALQQSTGGNLAVTLETLSEIIRKRRAVRLKAHAATAEIRVSALVLGAIPFFIVGALLLVSPGYLKPLIDDPRGNLIVGAAVASLVLAAVTMRTMMRAAIRA
jgi:tight adherence protein B